MLTKPDVDLSMMGVDEVEGTQAWKLCEAEGKL